MFVEVSMKRFTVISGSSLITANAAQMFGGKLAFSPM